MDGTGGSSRTLGNHADLRVWQAAMDLVVESYRLGELPPAREQFGLVAQIRRAATSIPANIAEGHGRVHRREYLHPCRLREGR